MTGTSTPTRSCLKRRLQLAKGSISGALSHASPASSNGSTSSLCKTVSFDGKADIYFADPDYDRHSVPVAHKLSYEDLLELKMLNVHMMCPQNKCSVVPVGILPLLETGSTPSTSAQSSPASRSPSLPLQPSTHRMSGLGIGKHLSAQNQHFVGLLDDDLASMTSTPPPSSPSDHSPSMSGAPLPVIATDEEGQLIFQFSASGDLDDALEVAHDRRHEMSDKLHVDVNGLPRTQRNLKTTSGNSNHQDLSPPFPVSPFKPVQSSHVATNLTPSFFTLPPQPSMKSAPAFAASSPFPFAPPVPTTNGLGLPSLPSLSMTAPSRANNIDSKSTPTTPKAHESQSTGHARSSSSSSTTSPLATPHASPTFTVHPNMRNPRPAGAADDHKTVPGPLAALRQQHFHHHPTSPQLSGLPSPSLVPPSPLSLYPPSLDKDVKVNGVMNTANPGGFFSNRKRVSSNSHARTGSLDRPKSPIVKPLKS